MTDEKPHAAYPGIYKAALEIAGDNGGINRGRSEAQHRLDFDAFMSAGQLPAGALKAIDAWLSALTDDEMHVVCAGEEAEMLAFIRDRQAPAFTLELLDEIFGEVC